MDTFDKSVCFVCVLSPVHCTKCRPCNCSLDSCWMSSLYTLGKGRPRHCNVLWGMIRRRETFRDMDYFQWPCWQRIDHCLKWLWRRGRHRILRTGLLYTWAIHHRTSNLLYLGNSHSDTWCSFVGWPGSGMSPSCTVYRFCHCMYSVQQ